MKLRIAVLTVFLVIFFSGCTAYEADVCCKMTVMSSYSGFGIDGQNLGSGSITKEYTVRSGEKYAENGSGDWYLVSNKGAGEATPIMEIISINEKSVTVVFSGTETNVSYNRKLTIPSEITVYDGWNYYYTFSFSPSQPRSENAE